MDRYDSRSSSDSSVSRQTATSPQSALLHRMTFPPSAGRHQPPPGGGATPSASSCRGDAPGSDDSAAEYPYVQFERDRPPSKHEYSYPALADLHRQREALRRERGETLHLKQPPLPPGKGAGDGVDGKRRPVESCAVRPLPRRCRHCQEPYEEATNGRGQCEYAPDAVRTCLDFVTCVPAAQCMLYHCCSDAEGDYGAARPCSCAPQQERCARRWLGLALLSLLLPCLCCYPPLSACYAACRRCHACGGKHGPATAHP